MMPSFAGYANAAPLAATPQELRAQAAKDILEGNIQPAASNPLAGIQASQAAAEGVVFDPIAGQTSAMPEKTLADDTSTADSDAKSFVGTQSDKVAAAKDILDGGLMQRARANTAQHKAVTQQNINTMNKAYGVKQQAVEDASELESQRLAEVANIEQQNIKEEEVKRAVHLDKQTKVKNEADARQAELAQREKAILEEKEDPDNIWRGEDGELSYGRKIAAVIATAMGAFGAGLTGGQNGAAKIISDSVDRDIAAQRANKQGRVQGLEREQTNIDRLMKQYGDAETAERIDRGERLAAHQRFLESINMEYASNEKQQAKQDAIAGIELERANNAQALQDRAANLAQSGLGLEAQIAASQGGGGPKPLAASEAQELAKLTTGKQMLDRLSNEFSSEEEGGSDAGHWTNVISRMMPWETEGGDYEEQRTAVAQVIASVINGKPAGGEKIDVIKDMLPKAGTNKTQAQKEIKRVADMLKGYGFEQIKNLQQSGFNAAPLAAGLGTQQSGIFSPPVAERKPEPGEKLAAR